MRASLGKFAVHFREGAAALHTHFRISALIALDAEPDSAWKNSPHPDISHKPHP